MSYYRKFGIVLGSPLFQAYLRSAYKSGIDDLQKLNYTPNFSRNGFTGLLCGVGNEGTAREFIELIIAQNPKAKIIIIDLGKEQVEAVKKLVKASYYNLNIKVYQINSLDLEKIVKKESVDWIETDGFLEFFDKTSLNRMLSVWFKILRKDGFITTRMIIYRNIFERLIDQGRVVVAKKWLNIITYSYSKSYFEKSLKENNFLYVDHFTRIPTFQSYSLIK